MTHFHVCFSIIASWYILSFLLKYLCQWCLCLICKEGVLKQLVAHIWVNYVFSLFSLQWFKSANQNGLTTNQFKHWSAKNANQFVDFVWALDDKTIGLILPHIRLLELSHCMFFVVLSMWSTCSGHWCWTTWSLKYHIVYIVVCTGHIVQHHEHLGWCGVNRHFSSRDNHWVGSKLEKGILEMNTLLLPTLLEVC